MEVLNDNNLVLEDLIKKAKIVIIVISTKWCGPCNSMTPIFESLSQEFKDLKIFKVDVTENIPSFVTEMKIKSVPYILFFRDGIMFNQVYGARNKEQIKDIINKII